MDTPNNPSGKVGGTVTLSVIILILIVIVLYAFNRPASQSSLSSPEPSSKAGNLMTEGTNGLDCKAIADRAAEEQQTSVTDGETTVVLKSHFSQAFNQCYYEILVVVPNLNPETEIDVAPDDKNVAWCESASPDGTFPTTCAENNTTPETMPGTMVTQDQFHQLENEYFTN